MAHAARPAQSRADPHDVADDPRPRLRLAAEPERRPLSRYHGPADPRRHLLHGSGTDRHREVDHHARRARGLGVAGGRSGGERLQAGRLPGLGLVPVRDQPGQRAVRRLAAHRADHEHAATGHPAAVQHQVRHHQHPGGPGGRRVGRAGREAALRSGPQRHRAAARADQGRRLRDPGRREGARDRGRAAARGAAGARARSARRRAGGACQQPPDAERQHPRRRPRLQRLREHAVPAGQTAGRRGGARTRAGGQPDCGPGARGRRGESIGLDRGPERDRPHQWPAGRVSESAQAAGCELDPGGGRGAGGAPEAARRPGHGEDGHLLRPVELHPGRRQGPRARGGAGRDPGGPGDPGLPRLAARHRHRGRRDSAQHRGYLHAALLLRADPQRVHARRAGARGGPAGRRFDRRAGEHPSPSGDGAEPQAGGAGGGPGSGHAHPGVDHHHHRGVLSRRVPLRNCAQPVSAARAHHLVCADHELLRLPHGHAAALHDVAARRVRHATVRRVRRLGDRPPGGARRRLCECAAGRAPASSEHHRRHPRVLRGLPLSLQAHRKRVLPRFGRVAIQPGLQGPYRHAGGEDGTDRPAARAGSEQDPGQGEPVHHHDHRQRPARGPDGDLQRQHGAARRDAPGQSGPARRSADQRRRRQRAAAQRDPGRASRDAALLLRRRDREADPQLRLRGPH